MIFENMIENLLGNVFGNGFLPDIAQCYMREPSGNFTDGALYQHLLIPTLAQGPLPNPPLAGEGAQVPEFARESLPLQGGG